MCKLITIRYCSRFSELVKTEQYNYTIYIHIYDVFRISIKFQRFQALHLRWAQNDYNMFMYLYIGPTHVTYVQYTYYNNMFSVNGRPSNSLRTCSHGYNIQTVFKAFLYTIRVNRIIFGSA